MHTRTTLATVALALNLPRATRPNGSVRPGVRRWSNTRAANINPMLPHYAGHNTAALENPHVCNAGVINELRGSTVQALAENLP